MRRKIAKRKRRECLRLGAVLEQEGWVKEPGWKRKQCGYSISANYNGWKIVSCGFDELEAYQGLLLAICTDD